MAEKIVIAELELNTKALQESNTRLIQDISRLRNEQKALKKETGNLANATQAQAQKYIENDAALKKLTGEYNTNKRVLAENTTGIKNLNNELAKEISNKTQAAANNKSLATARDQITSKTKAGRDAIAEINKKIDENNDFIKGNVSQLEQQKIGIGSYEESVISALNKVNLFGVGLGDLYQKSVKQKEELKKTAIATKLNTKETNDLTSKNKAFSNAVKSGNKSLKTFRIALAATGLGLVVIALAALAAGFISTQKGIDYVNRSLAPLKGAFEGIIGVVQKLSVNVFGQLRDRWTVIKNKLLIGITDLRIKWNEFTGDDQEAKSLKAYKTQLEKELVPAIERLKQKNEEVSKIWSNASKDIREAAKAQQKIVELGIQIEEVENRLIVKRSELNRVIKEQNKIAEDTTKSSKEREAAAIRSIEASKQLVKEEQKILNLKIKQKTIENSLNDTSRDDQKELNELVAQRNEKETQGLELQTTQTNKLNTIRQSAEAKRQKAMDKALKDSKILLDTFIAEQGERARTLEQELQLFEKIKERKIKILNDELQAKKITQKEFNLSVLELDNELLSKRVELAIDNASRELQIFKDNHQVKIEANTFFTEELLNQEINRLDLIAEKEQEYHQKRLEQGVINQQEYNDAINALNKENTIAKEDAENLREEAKKEKEAIDLDNERIISEENFLNEFEIKAQRLETQRQQELNAAEKNGADTFRINEKFDKREQKLEEAKQSNIRQGYANTFGQLSKLLGESSAAGKAFAIAQATMQGYEAVLNAYTTAQKSPITLLNPAYPAIQAGLAGVFSATQVANIAGVKFEKGGLQEVGGKPHIQGGTKFIGEDGTTFEAERGELIGVMNKNAARLFMEFNNQNLNYTSTPNTFQSGSFFKKPQSSKTIDINYDLLASKIGQQVSEANKSLPPNTLNFEYFNDAQNDLNEVVSGANR